MRSLSRPDADARSCMLIAEGLLRSQARWSSKPFATLADYSGGVSS